MLVVLAAGALVVLAWPVLVALALPAPIQPVALLAHVSGMLAGYSVLVLLVLMSRWPVLERGVGADRLTRWHTAGGRTVLTSVLVHALAATTAWAQLTGLGPWRAVVDVLAMPGLVAATVATSLVVAVAVASVRSARRRLGYETWHALHLSMYVAVALSFAHQLAGPDLAGRPVLQVAWALLYAWAFALVLRYRVLAPLGTTVRHRLRVASVTPEAPGVVSIVVTGRDLDGLAAEPGQFFRWRFLTAGLWASAHPFSLSAPPTGDRLRLTVKALGGGSSRVQQVEPGTWVVAEGPYGAMTSQRRTRRHVLLIAGGVGITPMRALFESLPVESDRSLVLLYRAPDRGQILFRQELDALAAQRRAHVVYLLGKDPDLLSAESLRRLVPDVVERDVYLCGPPRLSSAVRDSLATAGLPSGQLHEERFAF